jgi:hypothetical protein
MSIDYTKLLNKIVPMPDGEPPVTLRAMKVDSVNADGTLDLSVPGYTSGDVTVPPTVIPSVFRLSSAYVAAGDVVQILTHRGSMLVLGPVGGLVPGQRIASMTPRTTTPAAVTTAETVLDTVTADLVAGRTYKVSYRSGVLSSVAGDSAFIRIREDNVSGNALQLERIHSPLTGGSGSRWPADLEAEFTAVSTGEKTFVGTLIRASGTGDLTSPAGTGQPTYFYVDYVRG